MFNTREGRKILEGKNKQRTRAMNRNLKSTLNIKT